MTTRPRISDRLSKKSFDRIIWCRTKVHLSRLCRSQPNKLVPLAKETGEVDLKEVQVFKNKRKTLKVSFRPRVVVLALEYKGLIIGLHCTLFKDGINAKPSSLGLIHAFVWSLLRKDRLGTLIYSTDDRCYGNKCNGVCGCLHFSFGVLSQVATVDENCNDRHYCIKLISLRSKKNELGIQRLK